jgi:hypothetical protein
METNICSMPYVKIFGLSSQTRKKFNRALRLAGAGPQSKWLLTQIHRFIKQQEEKHGDLFFALTADEQWLVEVVASGAAEPEQIAQETDFALSAVERLLADLVARDVLEIRKQGGKTDQARGARRDLYFVSEKYQSRTE